MRYSQSARINLAHDRRKSNANDTYAAEDAIIQFGDNESMTWSEIKKAVDLTTSLLNNITVNTGATDAGANLSTIIDTSVHPTNFYVVNGAPNLTITNGNQGTLQVSGGVMNVTGENALINFTNSTHTSTLDEQALVLQDSADSSTTSINSLEISQTQSGKQTHVSPAKISMNSSVETPVSFTTETIDGLNCKSFQITLDGTQHETGPEYKLCVKIVKDGVATVSFSLRINIGSWFPTSGVYEQVKDLESLGAYSNVAAHNVFYKRVGNNVDIGWEFVTNSDTFEYKVLQIC